MKIQKGKQSRPQRVVIYGVEGIGKSTLAASAPAPLFLDTEKGSAHLDVHRVNVSYLGEIIEACQFLLQGQHEYKTLVLDTADNLYNMCAEVICIENKRASIESFDYGRGYTMTTERFIQMLDLFDKLTEAGISVVVIAHAKIDTISPPDANEFSRYCIKVCAPSKQAQKARERLKEWADALLFCKYDICVNTAEKKAVGQARRIVATTSTPAWEAKNRIGLPEQMPMTSDVIRRALLVDEQPESTPQGQELKAQPAQEHTTEKTTAEEDALLLDYFRKGTHVLNDSETLENLPPRIKTALQARRADALARAQEWKNKQA